MKSGQELGFFFLHILPLFWAPSEGGWLCHSCAALQAWGRWENAVPQAREMLGGNLALLPTAKTYFSWEIGGQEG